MPRYALYHFNSMIDFTDTKPRLREIYHWHVVNHTSEWAISSCGLTLELKFDELLAELCLLSTKCVLGKESKLSSSHSVRWPRKKASRIP